MDKEKGIKLMKYRIVELANKNFQIQMKLTGLFGLFDSWSNLSITSDNYIETKDIFDGIIKFDEERKLRIKLSKKIRRIIEVSK